MNVIGDTGPLVALFNPSDEFHDWAFEQYKQFTTPIIICEGVLTESLHLLRRVHAAPSKLLTLWNRGLLRIDFSAESEKSNIESLLKRFDNVPMSFTDACLVRLSEIKPNASIWTLDNDFRVYRRNGRQVIPLIIPD